MVGINEYTHDMGYRLLTTQLLCTSYCKVGNMSAQGVVIVDHTIEATTGADALLLGRNIIGDAICTIELLPCALNDDILECRAHPRIRVAGKVVCCFYSHGSHARGIASAYAPNFVDRV